MTQRTATCVETDGFYHWQYDFTLPPQCHSKLLMKKLHQFYIEIFFRGELLRSSSPGQVWCQCHQCLGRSNKELSNFTGVILNFNYPINQNLNQGTNVVMWAKSFVKMATSLSARQPLARLTKPGLLTLFLLVNVRKYIKIIVQKRGLILDFACVTMPTPPVSSNLALDTGSYSTPLLIGYQKFS